MATRVKERLIGKRYLGNDKNKEVHDLHNETANCQIDEIIEAGYSVVFTPDTLNQAHEEGYDNCACCMEDKMDLNLSIVLSDEYYKAIKKASKDLFYDKYGVIYPFEDFAKEKRERTKLTDLHLSTYTHPLWILYIVNVLEKPALENLPLISAKYAYEYAKIKIEPNKFLAFPPLDYPHVNKLVKEILQNPKLDMDDEYCAQRCYFCCEDKNCREKWGSDKNECLINCLQEKCNIK